MLHTFEDKEIVPDPVLGYEKDIASQQMPLVIDNGSYACKVGWACHSKPNLVFRNLIAKARAKKEGDFNGCLIGNDIGNLESMKWNLRTQFDRDVVTHFEAQEQIFDYTFSHLGIDTEGFIDHPIVITEALCNPNSFRQGMSELLFECYRVPQVAYGVDCLFSFNRNMKHANNSLIISSGYSATHVVPIYNGKIKLDCCKRINVGGMNANVFMQRLMQLKHPGLAAAVSVTRAQELIEKYTYTAPHFDEELRKWSGKDFARDNKRVIQLPYAKPEPVAQKDPEKEREKRVKQGRRLQELNAKKREEKLAQDEERFSLLLQLIPLEKLNQGFFMERLNEVGIDSKEELIAEVNELRTSIIARKEKMMNQSMEEPLAKKTKGEEKNITEGMTEEEIEGLVEELRKERMDILDKRKLREQRKQELANRKSHAAKERMRILTKLADGGKTSKRQKSEDTFGMNDEDWEVYKYISKEGSDSEDEQEQERLDEIESFLSQHDMEFIKSRQPAEDAALDLAVYYQLHLEVERIRVPEVLYQPCIIGLEQAGLSETIDYVLKKFPPDVQSDLVRNIFLTGGNTLFPGFKTRLENEMRSLRPFQSEFQIYFAENPQLDAWLGARDWTLSVPDLSKVSITRSDYEECGEGFLREHKSSNLYFQTPVTT